MSQIYLYFQTCFIYCQLYIAFKVKIMVSVCVGNQAHTPYVADAVRNPYIHICILRVRNRGMQGGSR